MDFTERAKNNSSKQRFGEELRQKVSTGQNLYRRAKRLIPGGTQLLSKRPEMFLPDLWPSYYSQARGVDVVDLDGNTYVDMSIMSVGACVLGYADPDVNEAIKAAVDNGSMCTLNAMEEVELAELLCKLHPWSQMVRYARSGGEAMAIAVRIARTHTRRSKIIFCGYHGWTDWYLAANLCEGNELDDHLMPGLNPAGVPSGLQGTAFPFHYNQLKELQALVHEHRSDLAAIVMEPQRDDPPQAGFLEAIREIATEVGAVLIYDEITTGFRMTSGGIHLLLGVYPDIAVFAKAMSNGYPMAAIIGIEKVMQSSQLTFISSTNWTDRLGPVAALATIRKYLKYNVSEHLIEIGNQVVDVWRQAAMQYGLKLHEGALPTLAHFNLKNSHELELTTLFTQIMLEKGFLAWNQFKPSFAHQSNHVDEYRTACFEAFSVMADAVERGDIHKRLYGPVAQRGFYRFA